jgi:cysteine-rich repeat protein
MAEGCGNGRMDVGEECDDGNSMSHDGCSSGCLVEQPVWTEITTPGPTLRRGHAMAWLPDRGYGVLHGGTGAAVLNETWIWNGAWTQVANGPDRTFHTIAWDRDGQLVMFGGTDQTAIRRAESFAWDGTQWNQLGGTNATARFDHVMGPGVVPGQLMMYGGQNATGINVELWQRDAAGWQLVTNDATPLRVQNVRFTFDPIANAMFSIGGDINSHKTFSWNGSAFTETGEGLVRTDQVQDYDPARRRIVVFSGTAGPATNETNEFDGTTWTRVDVVGSPPPARTRAAGFYDPIRHELVIMGGASGASFRGDTWVLRWQSATPDDACDGTDLDGDGAIGCDDPDCWARCTPRCPPGASCAPGQPQCGDGTCNSDLETHELCPDDC